MGLLGRLLSFYQILFGYRWLQETENPEPNLSRTLGLEIDQYIEHMHWCFNGQSKLKTMVCKLGLA